MSLAKNSRFRLATLLFSTGLPAMFVGVPPTVANVPGHAQSVTPGGRSGNIADASGAVILNPIDLDHRRIPLTEKEKV